MTGQHAIRMINGHQVRGPIVLASRNSGQQSRRARAAAAREIHLAAEDLFRLTDIDVRTELPSEEELATRLKSESRRVKSKDVNGKQFTNEYLVIGLPTCILFISTGSGAKLTEDFAQPFLNELSDFVLAQRAGVLCFHRQDRLFRTFLQGAHLLSVAKELGTIWCDGEHGNPRPLEDMDAFMNLFRANGSADEARKMPKKTRNGQRARSDGRMVDGRARYAAAVVPPPGCMTVRMRTEGGAAGDQMLLIDTPTNYPPDRQVAYGLPEVFRDGERVDQAALVQWALKNLGRPGYTNTTVGAELALRGFSTARLRQETVSASFEPEAIRGQEWRAVRPILSNLDFYKTGTFVARLGVPEVPDIVITDCFPPGGVWAADDDFARIDAYLASTRGGGPAALGLTGLSVATDHGRATLRAASNERSHGCDAYVVKTVRGIAGRRVGYPALPHHVLAESIVASLVAFADELLVPLAMQELPEARDVRALLERARRDHERAGRQADALLAGFFEVDGAGTPVMSLTTRAAVSRQHEQYVAEHVEPRAREVAELETRLLTLTTNSLTTDEALKDSLLLHLVASLRDSRDTRYNGLWKQAARIDTITRVPIKRYGISGTVTSWAGTIQISGAGHTFSAPWSGEYLDGALSRIEACADEAVEAMRRGVPFNDQTIPNADAVRTRVAEKLGFAPRHCGLTDCPDPTLVKIGAHLATEANGSDAAVIASRLDVPVALVREVAVELRKGRRSWSVVIEGWSSYL